MKEMLSEPDVSHKLWLFEYIRECDCDKLHELTNKNDLGSLNPQQNITCTAVHKRRVLTTALQK